MITNTMFWFLLSMSLYMKYLELSDSWDALQRCGGVETFHKIEILFYKLL